MCRLLCVEGVVSFLTSCGCWIGGLHYVTDLTGLAARVCVNVFLKHKATLSHCVWRSGS